MDTTFGVEIEMIANRALVVEIVSGLTGLQVTKIDDDTYKFGEDQWPWKVERDETIEGVDEDYQTEIISPRLSTSHLEKELEMLTGLLKALSNNGASVNEYCGIHVHVYVPTEEYAAVSLLAKIMQHTEPAIYENFGVSKARRKYCAPLPAAFLEKLEQRKPSHDPMEELRALANAWYGEDAPHRALDRYDDSRYHGLNLQSWLYRRTVEFRYFNSSLEPTDLEKYIRFALAAVDLARQAAIVEKKVEKKVGGERRRSRKR